MKTSILQFLLERLDHGIAQLLRGYFCGNLRVIILRVIISPLVVFISADLSGLGAALGALAEQGIQMIYDTIHQVLA